MDIHRAAVAGILVVVDIHQVAAVGNLAVVDILVAADNQPEDSQPEDSQPVDIQFEADIQKVDILVQEVDTSPVEDSRPAAEAGIVCWVYPLPQPQ